MTTPNHIKVKCDIVREITTAGGIIIPIEQGREYAGAKNYQATKYAPTHGVVVEVGEKSLGVKNGDTVIFHFNTEETCKQQGKMEVHEDTKFFYIEASKVMCIIRDGKPMPTNGWLLANRAEKAKEVTSGGIFIPEAHRKESDRKFRVVAVHDGYEDCKVGDVIYTEIDCDIPLEANDLLGIVPNDLFRINTENIVAVEYE